MDRWQEMQEKLQEERVARERLKRRFDQTQEIVSWTISTHMTILADQILAQMDVDSLTRELQIRSRRKNAARQAVSRERPPSSLASSIDVVYDHDTGSEVPSMISTSQCLVDRSQSRPSSLLSTSGLQSWVESSGTPPQSFTVHEANAPLSDSIVTMGTTTSASGENASVADSLPSESIMSSSIVSDSSNSRSKAELWNEVKILTFTRVLTTLYSTTLLSLLTVIQLTLLARSKYIHSIVQLEREERFRERFEAQLSIRNLLFGGGAGLQELMEEGREDDDEEDQIEGAVPMSEEVESRFLTMSWWILHVGWKGVAERVRRGVEEAFDGVSLKSNLGLMDLHRLISDVRRRVEHEVTFEGHDRRINFLSSLLPSTPETVQHVLTQGGFPSSTPPHDAPEPPDTSTSTSVASSSQLSPPLSHRLSLDFHTHTYAQHPVFTALLDETLSTICSSDFAFVLEACLDRATHILFRNLEQSVFHSPSFGSPQSEVQRMRLADLLPGLARWSVLAMTGNPNELVDNLLAMREVQCLSAIVFARFEEKLRG